MQNASTDAVRYCITCGYPLDGLLESRCPECGTRFDVSDDRTFASEPRRLRTSPAITAAFCGAFLGGMAGYILLALVNAYVYQNLKADKHDVLLVALFASSLLVLAAVPVFVFPALLRLIHRRWVLIGLMLMIGVLLAGLGLRLAVLLWPICAGIALGFSFGAHRRFSRSAAGMPYPWSVALFWGPISLWFVWWLLSGRW